MSFEKPTNSTESSKEALFEAISMLSANVEESKTEIAEIRSAIWSHLNLTQNEKVELLSLLIGAEQLLSQQQNFVERVA